MSQYSLDFKILLILLGIFFCCKPRGGTRLTSLDNLEAGGVAFANQCTGSFNLIIPKEKISIETADPTEAEDYFATLAQVLKAVPDYVQVNFLAMGGKIQITDKFPPICAGPHDAHACFAAEAALNGGTIFIKKNEASLRHGVVRAFGIALNHYIARAREGTQKNTLVIDPAINPQFHSHVNNIWAQFKLDLLNRNPNKARDPNFAQQINQSFNDSGLVFAEAFDSYFCSAQSKSTFINLYKRTYAAFTPVAQFIVNRYAEGGAAKQGLSLAQNSDLINPSSGDRRWMSCMSDFNSSECQAAISDYDGGNYNPTPINSRGAGASRYPRTSSSNYPNYNDDYRYNNDPNYRRNPNSNNPNFNGAGGPGSDGWATWGTGLGKNITGITDPTGISTSILAMLEGNFGQMNM